MALLLSDQLGQQSLRLGLYLADVYQVLNRLHDVDELPFNFFQHQHGFILLLSTRILDAIVCVLDGHKGRIIHRAVDEDIDMGLK